MCAKRRKAIHTAKLQPLPPAAPGFWSPRPKFLNDIVFLYICALITLIILLE